MNPSKDLSIEDLKALQVGEVTNRLVAWVVRLVRIILFGMGRMDLMDDAVQKSLVDLWRGCMSFREEACPNKDLGFRRWSGAVVRHAVFRVARRSKHAEHVSLDACEHDHPASNLRPDELVEFAEFYDLVRDELHRQSQRMKVSAASRLLDGMSYAEIVEQHAEEGRVVPLQTARSDVTRFRRRMQDRYLEYAA